MLPSFTTIIIRVDIAGPPVAVFVESINDLDAPSLGAEVCLCFALSNFILHCIKLKVTDGIASVLAPLVKARAQHWERERRRSTGGLPASRIESTSQMQRHSYVVRRQMQDRSRGIVCATWLSSACVVLGLREAEAVCVYLDWPDSGSGNYEGTGSSEIVLMTGALPGLGALQQMWSGITGARADSPQTLAVDVVRARGTDGTSDAASTSKVTVAAIDSDGVLRLWEIRSKQAVCLCQHSIGSLVQKGAESCDLTSLKGEGIF